MTKLQYSFSHGISIKTPLGLLSVKGNHSHIQFMKYEDEQSAPAPISAPSPLNEDCEWAAGCEWEIECRKQVHDYFAGTLTAFTLPIDPIGTDFQKSVWHHLQLVENGETCSYQQLAQSIGNPNAVRAVASANARNPIWILIPCHRIIGTDGALRGYAGGLERKAELLKLERHTLSKITDPAVPYDEKTRVLT